MIVRYNPHPPKHQASEVKEKSHHDVTATPTLRAVAHGSKDQESMVVDVLSGLSLVERIPLTQLLCYCT